MMRRLTPVAAAVLVLSLAYARPARAQADEEPVKAWYGWQIIIADAAAWGGVLLSFGLNDRGYENAAEAVAATSGLVYTFGGPGVHVYNERGGTAAASFGLRLLLPTIGILGGAVVGDTVCDDDCGFLGGMEYVAYGMFAGMAISQVLDWVDLSRPSESQSSSTTDSVAARFIPTVMLVPSGAGVGLGGSF